MGFFVWFRLLKSQTKNTKKTMLPLTLHILVRTFHIPMSVHRNIITNYSQQDATFLKFIITDVLHLSVGSSAHHQEHKTVHTASGIVNQYCC